MRPAESLHGYPRINARPHPGHRARNTNLAFRLTGRVSDAVAAQVGYIPFDSRQQRWAGASDFRWKLFGVNRELLPELVPAGHSMGQISAVAAEQTGIPAGLVLYASGADKACEVLGSEAWSPDIANVSYGIRRITRYPRLD